MQRVKLLAIVAMMSCGATSGADVATAQTAQSVRDAEQAAAPATARVTRVALFKNGYGFVFREVAVRAGTTVRVAAAPHAVLGTLWAYPSAGNVTVRNLRAVEGLGTEPRDCAALPDLLRSSVGHRVRLSRTTEHGAQSYTGTVARAVGDDLFLLRPESGSCPETESAACGGLTPGGGAGGAGLLAFTSGQFDSVVFLDEPPQDCSAQVKETQLIIDVGGSGEGKIEFTALEEGLKWVPEYRVERTADDKVRLTLQGALVDDVVDLDDATVDLVVGVPHYLMSGTLSPMVIESTLQNVVTQNSYYPQSSWSQREWNSNVMQTQMSMPYQGGSGGGGGGESAADLGGVGTGEADELTLYHLEHVTLAKGERSLVRVFSVEVPVEDVYRWDVNGTEAEANSVLQQALAGDPSAIERVSRARVWHHLHIHNRSDQPWTTAPAVYFKDGNVVAQDRITYTPAGSEVDLRLTMATDVLVSFDDTEDRRDRQAKVIDGSYYDLITGHGTLTARSHEDHDIQLVVVRRMMGTISQASDSGTVHAEPGSGGWSPYQMWSFDPYASDYGYSYDWSASRVNSPTWCEWKITLHAGQEQSLTYQFKYYTQ
jgi:hypothetical protein